MTLLSKGQMLTGTATGHDDFEHDLVCYEVGLDDELIEQINQMRMAVVFANADEILTVGQWTGWMDMNGHEYEIDLETLHVTRKVFFFKMLPAGKNEAHAQTSAEYRLDDMRDLF